jgi:hypothetical protein
VDVSYYVTSCGHVAFVGVGFGNVYDAVKEIGLAVLATEVLRNVSILLMRGVQGALTLLSMSSWLERWVLQFLQP